ncbi:universal stress protein [Streptomyces sp. NPDC000983]|uniref:universal stress protein n=1 Tax=Streptomyces sp. NPDC000983 TaxID=3154373 RepID=UPI00332BB88B
MGENAGTRRVVVGVDGSPSSGAALRWAVRYAALVDARVDAVSAWNLPGADTWSAPAVDADVDEAAARQALTQELDDVLGAESAGAVHARLARGNPVEVLLRAAEGAEILVVGSRGRGGFARALLGSVSHHVAQHAQCPVVIVRAESGRGSGAESG